MIKVPFLDVGAAYRELKSEIDSAVLRTMNSGWYILGDEVEAFEKEYASFCGVRNCVAVGNGLDALVLSLRAMNIGVGDEVIVPANTFIATLLAVSQVGAMPVLVEADDDTFNLNPMLVEQAITTKCKAIIPVHLYGQPADLEPLLAIAKRHGLQILEDAAQAQGAGYYGKRIGGHGNAVSWSFYPGKNLGALGDGGAITTNDDNLACELRKLRNYGSSKKYVHELKGVNSRLDPLQAAVLREKLKVLAEWNLRRGKIAERYLAEFAKLDLRLPIVPKWADPVWHLFVVRSSQRDAIQEKLEKLGVQTQIHYPIPPHLQDAYAELGYEEGSFPIAEKMANEVFSLPVGPQMSDEQVEQVVMAVKAVLG